MSGLGRAVRENLQEIGIESAWNKDGFTSTIAVDGPNGEEPMCEGIFLKGLVMVFLGADGSCALESCQRSGQRQWRWGLEEGKGRA